MTLRKVECLATMESKAVENHTHTCSGYHAADGSHFCPECSRWWWRVGGGIS